MIKNVRLSSDKDKIITLLIGLTILILVSFFSLCVGSKFISVIDIVKTLKGLDNKNYFVIFQYRIPRMLVGIFAGANLAIAGAIFQSVLKNPLASSDVVGVTKGAGLGTIIAVMFLSKKMPVIISLSAILGAFIISILLYVLSTKSKFNNSMVALVGVALGAVCDAAIQFLTINNRGEINAALVWLTGSLWGRYWNEFYMILPFSIVLISIILSFSTKLDVINLGDELARSLGEKVSLLRWMLLVLATMLCATAVSVTGTIGFIGLTSPHIAKQLVGFKHKLFIPFSGVVGAIILLLADVIARWIFAPIEIPTGIVTSIIGAPYFLYLLVKKNNV